MCGLRIEVEGGRVGRIEADKDDPLSRGALCPKAVALGEIQHDPDRLTRPRRRVGDGWQEISWGEAIPLAATRLAAIQREHGDDAVASYLGNPGAHNLGVLLGLTPLLGALSSRNRYSASSLDQNPKHASSVLLYGHWLRIPIPDVDRTQFLLMLGANPVVSGGSLMTAPGFRKRVEALQARGGRLVVVDPRRSETARLADAHLSVVPGSDGFLLAALVHTVLEEGLGRANDASARIVGRDALRASLAPFAPEAVAAQVGVPADGIRELARDFAAASSAVCYGRVGTSQHRYGTLCSWLADVLTLVTGNLDREGGAMFPAPAADLAQLASLRGDTDELITGRTRVRGAPQFNGESPTACLAEEIATPGDGQVRGLLTIAGNPVLSAPNGQALEAAIASLDFHVAIDFYVNETTRHADLILPPTWSLEHDNCEVLFHGFAVRNTIKLSQKVVDPAPGTRDDWSILTELGFRLQEAKAENAWGRFVARTLRRIAARLTPRQILALMLRIGPHGDGFRPWRRGVRIADLDANPSGIDLGPLEPSLERIVATERGRLDLGAGEMMGELERLARELGDEADAGLVLIGRRDMRTCNSWLHNTRVGSKGRERCTLQMHPDDAAARGLAPGSPVRVTSRVGSLVAPLELSEDLRAGVVSLPHGWGHRGDGLELSVAAAHPGVNCNELVDDQVLEGLVGNAVYNGVPIQVEAAR